MCPESPIPQCPFDEALELFRESVRHIAVHKQGDIVAVTDIRCFDVRIFRCQPGTYWNIEMKMPDDV